MVEFVHDTPLLRMVVASQSDPPFRACRDQDGNFDSGMHVVHEEEEENNGLISRRSLLRRLRFVRIRRR